MSIIEYRYTLQKRILIQPGHWSVWRNSEIWTPIDNIGDLLYTLNANTLSSEYRNLTATSDRRTPDPVFISDAFECFRHFKFSPNRGDICDRTIYLSHQGQAYRVTRKYTGNNNTHHTLSYDAWEAFSCGWEDKPSHTTSAITLDNNFQPVTWGNVAWRQIFTPDLDTAIASGIPREQAITAKQSHNEASAYRLITLAFPETRPHYGLLYRPCYGCFSISTQYGAMNLTQNSDCAPSLARLPEIAIAE